MNKKLKAFVISSVAILIVAAVSITILLVLKITPETEIAKVNGEPIYAGEWKLSADRKKSSVLSHYKELGLDTSSADFWNTEKDGKTPTEYLREISLEDAVQYKLQLVLAKEYNLLDDISFSGLVEQKNKTNIDNLAKIKVGEPVIGQRTYTLSTFYDYRLSNLKLDLQKAMGEKGKPFYADEQTLKNFFDSVKDEFYHKTDSFVLAVVEKTNGEVLPEQTAKDIASLMNNLKMDFESLSAKVVQTHHGVTINKIEFSDESASSFSKQKSELFEAVQSLKSGESAVYNEEGSFKTVYCISRKDAGYKNFSDVYDAVLSQYRAIKYEEYIENLTKNAKVEKLSAYDRINMDLTLE